MKKILFVLLISISAIIAQQSKSNWFYFNSDGQPTELLTDFTIELFPNHIFSAYLYTYTIGTAISANFHEVPEVTWLSMNPSNFTSTSCSDVVVITLNFSAPNTPGNYFVELQDSNNNWAPIYVYLTVTSAPTLNTTYDTVYANVGQIINSNLYTTHTGINTTGWMGYCGPNPYVPGPSQTYEYILNPTVDWLSFSPSIFTVNLSDTVTVQRQFSALSLGTFQTCQIRNIQWFARPAYRFWTFIVQNPIDTGLVAYYPFNGNTNDESGYGNHGTTIGGATLTTNRFGNSNSAMHFNGLDGYVTIANSASLQSPTNELTISGWIFIEDFLATPVAGLVMKTISNIQGEYGLGYAETPDGTIYYVQNGTAPGYASIDLPWNKWHFMASTYDGDSVKIYADGNLLGTQALIGPIIPDDNPLVLGLETNGVSEYLKGKLDDIRIYNRGLSYNEIDSLYHEGGWPDLVAYYPFNGNANDESGYGNHGTVFGNTTFATDRFGNPSSSFYFNGSTYIDCGDPSNNTLDIGNNATINVWVNVDLGNGGEIIGKYDDAGNKSWGLYYYWGYFIFHMENPGYAWFGPNQWQPVAYEWYNLCMVKEGPIYSFYVNSIFMAAFVRPDVPDVNAPLLIGKSDPNYFWEVLDDLRIYNRPLSQAEIDSLYHLGGWLPTEFQLSVNIADKWNMVSIPGLHPLGQHVNTWWSGKDPAANVFKYNNGYQAITQTVPGEGYWMKHIGDTTYSTGNQWPVLGIQTFPHNPINASAGWNLIGGYENNAAVVGIATNPPGLQDGPVYGYSGGYQIATNLIPGFGYWIKLSGAGQIILPNALSKGTKVVKYFKEDWGKIIITDNAGKCYVLYSVNGEVDLNKYELPPVAPEGMFDIRFSSGRIAEDINSAIQIIEMSGVTYPLTVRVEGMDIRLMDETGKQVNVNLKSGEDIVISDATIQKLMVTGELIPAVYALEQNYPNPFNQSTVIKFLLPEDVSNVKLSIFNVLGEKVAELVNTSLAAGDYQYQWNARNLATGIYIYELRSDNFVSVKKMIFLK